jgi:hypothetical protein
MKMNSKVTSQLMILTLAGLLLILMIQVAKAQDLTAQNSLAQAGSNPGSQAQILQLHMPKKSLGRKILEDTSLSYYQQFLGPTMSGPTNETYNVFQEGIDTPRTGRAPLQSFHAVNLRYQISNNWAVGASLAAVNGYTKEVENRQNITNTPDSSFFNARAYVSLPAWHTGLGSLFSTVSYEAPTSVISRNDEMTWGLVINESFAFKSHNPRWSYGITGQYYRMFFNHERNVKPPPFVGGNPTQLQTVIISAGPYASYRFNDNWQMSSLITLDWDQRGVQTDSREFNNNLPHRGRLGVTYFPNQIKYLSSVGLFSQALLKFRPETTAFGGEFALRF